MDFIRNFPFFSIMISMLSGIISSILPKKAAKLLNLFMIITVFFLSLILLIYLCITGESFVYMMGHFPAPYGNEIRAGILEALMALFFSAVMFLSVVGGHKKLDEEVDEDRHNLYYILVNMMLSSLLALVYTNDLFTAYVFVEINTISACGLIMIRRIGRTYIAAVRYMIMSLIGSGLMLLGICLIYDMTGHLLMSNIKSSIEAIHASGQFRMPLVVMTTLISVGLCVKSSLFPFHAWLPDAYGYSTVSSAAILSSLVSKGYIFLLLKIIYRVIGFEVFVSTNILNVFYVFGLSAMIFGSIRAIRENDIRRMIAYSSIAQIGYIYMGFGLATDLGMEAGIFQILSHGATKSLLFIAAIGLTDVSGFNRAFIHVTGAGYRNKIAGIGFTVGALSMVGVPMFSGFISKLLFAEAGINVEGKSVPTLVVLAISVILNAIYFMKTVIRIYTPAPDSEFKEESFRFKDKLSYSLTILGFIALNLVLGMSSEVFNDLIHKGLEMFS
ncbi:MAG: sodium:proton antiporter [Lachnospiraceae bacterium]|nr:sodium:proton antiporter [Lachnospiraceae bacterium]